VWRGAPCTWAAALQAAGVNKAPATRMWCGPRNPLDLGGGPGSIRGGPGRLVSALKTPSQADKVRRQPRLGPTWAFTSCESAKPAPANRPPPRRQAQKPAKQQKRQPPRPGPSTRADRADPATQPAATTGALAPLTASLWLEQVIPNHAGSPGGHPSPPAQITAGSFSAVKFSVFWVFPRDQHHTTTGRARP